MLSLSDDTRHDERLLTRIFRLSQFLQLARKMNMIYENFIFHVTISKGKFWSLLRVGKSQNLPCRERWCNSGKSSSKSSGEIWIFFIRLHNRVTYPLRTPPNRSLSPSLNPPPSRKLSIFQFQISFSHRFSNFPLPLRILQSKFSRANFNLHSIWEKMEKIFNCKISRLFSSSTHDHCISQRCARLRFSNFHMTRRIFPRNEKKKRKKLKFYIFTFHQKLKYLFWNKLIK